MPKKVLILLIIVYQKTISPDHGFLKKIGLVRKQVCSFYPTCSEYGIQAIQKYGAIKGGKMTIKRILRCNPFSHAD